jgi:hypothetical protein
MARPQRPQILGEDLQLVQNPVNLGLLLEGDRPVLACHREQAIGERQLLVVRRRLREVSRHFEVSRAAEETVAVLGQADNHRRLVGRHAGLRGHQTLHGPRLLVADVAVRQRDPAEQVGEAGDLPGMVRFQRVQRIHQVTQRR